MGFLQVFLGPKPIDRETFASIQMIPIEMLCHFHMMFPAIDSVFFMEIF